MFGDNLIPVREALDWVSGPADSRRGLQWCFNAAVRSQAQGYAQAQLQGYAQ